MQNYILNAEKAIGLPFGRAETNEFAMHILSYVIRQKSHLLKQRKYPKDGEVNKEKSVFLKRSKILLKQKCRAYKYSRMVV